MQQSAEAGKIGGRQGWLSTVVQVVIYPAGQALPMWRLSERAQACVQKLHGLLSSTSWSRPWQRENDIVALLERIKDREEPAAVCAVAQCLFEPSQRIKTAASQTIRHLLSLVSPDQLTHLDDAVGWSSGSYISDDWDKLAPESVSALLVDAGSRAAVLGLLSFHRNGYVRHEAVRLLAREETGERRGTKTPSLSRGKSLRKKGT
ncbi:MAG TPA: hypothetical protein VJ783_18245 [Pirellulales bacterium]|nr:hypothetical protein [Pirellulales bacterium]